MISAGLLIIYSVTGGTLGAGYLGAAAWTARAPRLAVLVWQALAASIMLALGAAGLLLAVSLAPIGSGLADVLHLCASNLRRGYAASGDLMPLVGLGVLGLLAGRLVWCAIRVMRTTTRERRDCREAVQLLGRADRQRGAVIVDHDLPYAFCIGGRSPRIVMTSGLTATLSEPEIVAVVAHEAAHLRQRHDTCLVISQTLFLALSCPFVAFRQALPHVRALLELSADDDARRRAGTVPLRTALHKLACRTAPRGALAASGESVNRRLQRLDQDLRPLGFFRTISAVALVAVEMVLPVVLAAAPAATLARTGLCFVG